MTDAALVRVPDIIEVPAEVPAETPAGLAPLLGREWLVANGRGGYASGTVAGACTRRYHALLVAALATPLGRTVTLVQLWERLRLPGQEGRVVQIGSPRLDSRNSGSSVSRPMSWTLFTVFLLGGRGSVTTEPLCAAARAPDHTSSNR